jgi:hypothetical protein
MLAPCFITYTLKLRENEKHQSFYIQKAVDRITGKVMNTSRFKNGTLLVGVYNEKQAYVLLKVNVLGSYPIDIERYSSLNSSRVVGLTLFMECLMRRCSLLLPNSLFYGCTD